MTEFSIDPPLDKKPANYKKWGSVLLPFIFIFGKLKWVLAIAKFAKFKTLITMIISVWAYAQIWGASFALGFVVLIYIHEMGHLLVMRQMGIRAGAPVFIPFMGAVIAMKDYPRNALVESYVGLGGPALGTLGAGICLGAGIYTDRPIWYAFASTGFLINLFNMLPISPMDGGRITGAISKWFWLPGFIIGFLIFLKTSSPILFLVMILGAFSLFKSSKNTVPGYYDIQNGKRVFIAGLYFALLFIMVLGMWYADLPLKGMIH